jgi:hypothetical protein
VRSDRGRGSVLLDAVWVGAIDVAMLVDSALDDLNSFNTRCSISESRLLRSLGVSADLVRFGRSIVSGPIKMIKSIVGACAF